MSTTSPIWNDEQNQSSAAWFIPDRSATRLADEFATCDFHGDDFMTVVRDSSPLRHPWYASDYPTESMDPLSSTPIRWLLESTNRNHREYAENESQTINDQLVQIGDEAGVPRDFSEKASRMVDTLLMPGIPSPRILFDECEGEFNIQWFSGQHAIEISIPQNDTIFVGVCGFSDEPSSGFYAALPVAYIQSLLSVLYAK